MSDNNIFDPSELKVDFSKIEKKNIDSSSRKKKDSDSKMKKNSKKKIEKKEDSKDILDSIKIDTKSKKTSTKKNEKTISNKYREKKSDLKKTEKNTKKTISKKNTHTNSKEKEERVIDINIKSIEGLVNLLIDNKYDFLTIEPLELDVKISCQKDSKIEDVKYIRYHIYSKILINIKQLTNLEIEEIEKEQEGKGIFESKENKFNIISKTVPSAYGEKIFLKATKILKEKVGKTQKKASLGKILGVLGSASFVTLILGGAFITFVVLNANDLKDVNFFHSLGISLNDINSFIAKIVVVIFSILLFIETVFSAIYLFKFILTKKKFRKKKVLYAMIAIISIIITSITGSIWMVVDAKIRSLPNWQELAYGNVQLYDNNKLISKFFEKKDSLIMDTSNLIGPITIKYDLSIFEKKEKQKGTKVKKYIWNIDGEKIEELKPTLIKKFEKKGNFEISLIVEEEGLNGKIIKKEVENISSISITNIVEIKEELTSNGGKMIRFNANDLKELGKLEWYMQDDLNESIWNDYIFKPSKIFFKESMILLKIKRSGKKDDGFDKIFIIKGDTSNSIGGEIKYTQSIKNDLEYELKIINPKTNFGEGFIEEFEWVFGDKTIIKKADPINLEESSMVKFKFNDYGKNKAEVILKDSSGQNKKISIIIDIPKKITLKKHLIILNEDEKIGNLRYNKKNNEYFIDELAVPTELQLDARFIKPENKDNYILDKVTWDFDNDQGIDKIGKTIKHNIILEGNHTIVVDYTFVNRKLRTDIIKVKEKIYIQAMKKDALLNLKIEKESDYVPTIVSFDSSKSSINGDNIVKFIYDYGDGGVPEERDSINPGHKYYSPGEYKVKLTVIGESGKSYSIEKNLILKPEPQKAKIGVSMKKAPIGQEIDFFSVDSKGQIIGYFWDFGDGGTSIDANPSHSYDKPGKYKIKLKLDFANNNSLKDEMKIEIYYPN